MPAAGCAYALLNRRFIPLIFSTSQNRVAPKLEQEAIEAEIAERKRIQREAAIEEERLWYEQHGKDYTDYEEEDEEDEEDE
ncbi:hypothetical protein [Nostoc sp.]|uniref:hypothetical protein n=1 Tax=Nostoc sp. TaxID=1180 RepID=UPI002FFAE08A